MPRNLPPRSNPLCRQARGCVMEEDHAFVVLRSERYRLMALIRKIESNEHEAQTGIDHSKEIMQLGEINAAIERLSK